MDFTDTVEGLADKLAFSGVEVEGIERLGGGVPGVVVAEVLAIEKHPNADKLTLCKVNYGGPAEMTVVCGARAWPWAGSTRSRRWARRCRPASAIEKRKVRGVFSEGMLCAEDELGISKNHDGLMVLDAKWAPGTALSEVLGPPETVVEVEITPNRPDCLSLLGIAREVAALYGTQGQGAGRLVAGVASRGGEGHERGRRGSGGLPALYGAGPAET